MVVVATAVIGTIPKLASRWFYQRGDTAVQFAPTWYHLGRLTRDGVFPAWLDPSTWAGGNYAAEALFGIYDPLNIPIWLAMSSASDLMTMMFLIKLVFLVAAGPGDLLPLRRVRRRSAGRRPRWPSRCRSAASPSSGTPARGPPG